MPARDIWVLALVYMDPASCLPVISGTQASVSLPVGTGAAYMHQPSCLRYLVHMHLCSCETSIVLQGNVILTPLEGGREYSSISL